MYLKSLEISGFKSFAKKAVLEFPSPITGIVGPNGSGKSNVAEAFRFVLGEQSIKSMRGKRGEDLIYSGSSSSGRLNRAGVKVVFDNANRQLNLDFDEVSIERVVHRDGVNEYFINGSTVRLKDIAELLAQAHIGSSGHHIISQGEADRILSASLKERRDMIEDALGLKVYLYKRAESERKLEKTQENIKQVESLRREIAPHVTFLAKQVEKIQKAEKLREDLRVLYMEYLTREHWYIGAEKTAIRDALHMPTHRLKELEQQRVFARSVLEKGVHSRGEPDALLAFETSLRQLRETESGIVRDLGRLDGIMTSLEYTLKKEREAQLSDDAKTVLFKDVRALVAVVGTEIAAAVDTGDAPRLKQALVAIRLSLTQFITDRSTVRNTHLEESTRKELAAIADEKKAKEHELSVVRTHQQESTEHIARARQEIEDAKDASRDAEMAVLKIMGEEQEIRVVIAGLDARKSVVTREEEGFKHELAEAGSLVGREVLGILDTTPSLAYEDRSVQHDRHKLLERTKIRLEDAGVSGATDVMKEFSETKDRDLFLKKEITDLEASVLSLGQLITELTHKLDEEFKSGIKKINEQFGTFFALMFGGGHAALDVVKQEKRRRRTDGDELADALAGETPELEAEAEEGIDISVALPHKKTKGLMMLSGGERALTSIALLFAISQVNPPPFVILDETDAALDEANSRKYGDMIESLSKYSQLILITHNRETMSRAGVLYGVTMGSEGFSRLLSIAFQEAVQVAK